MARENDSFRAYPGLKVLVPFMTGIVCSSYVEEWTWGLVCFVLPLLWVWRKANQFVFYWGILFAVLWFCLGGLVGRHQNRPLESEWTSDTISCQALLVSPPEYTEKSVRAEALIIHQVHQDSLQETDRRIFLSFYRDSISSRLSVGDAVAFRTVISEPRSSGNPYAFDYASYLKRNGITGQAFLFSGQWLQIPDGSRLLPYLSSWERMKLFFLQQRERLVNRMREDGLRGDAFAVYAALAVGDDSYLNRELEDLYSQTGTTHILALSGMHLGILMALFYLLFAHGVKYTRWRWALCVLAWMFIWLYTFLAGLPTSLVRASLMYSFSMWGMMIYRRHFTLNILFWAACIMLLCDANSLYDVGFQLSYAAMLGILLFEKKIEGIFRISFGPLRYLWSAVSVSLAAQLTTLPLILYYFHYLPTTSVWSTLSVSFLSLLLLYCLPVYLILSCVPLWTQELMRVVSLLVDCQNRILQWFADWPHALVGPFFPDRWELLAFYILLVCLWFYRVRTLRLYSSMGLVFCVAFLYVHANDRRTHRVEQPQLIFYENYKQPAAHILFSAQESYLLPADTLARPEHFVYLRQTFWDRCLDNEPVFLSDSLYVQPHLASGGGLVYTPYFTLGILHAASGKNLVWSGVEHLDYLYLCKGFRGEVLEVLQKARPELVVLDVSLTSYERRKYLRLCEENQWNYHDMEEKGVLKVAF